MKYYALFKNTEKAIEVEFPDLNGCVTFGKNWEDTYENSIGLLGRSREKKKNTEYTA